jgi:hypothetical protein
MNQFTTATLAIDDEAAVEQALNRELIKHGVGQDNVNNTEILSGPHNLPDKDLSLYAVAVYYNTDDSTEDEKNTAPESSEYGFQSTELAHSHNVDWDNGRE